MQSHSTTVADYEAILAHVPSSGRPRAVHTACGALGYTRVSKSIQTTLDIQQEHITRLAHRLAVPLLRCLSDTGSGMKSDREGYQQLLAEARTEHYNYVLLYRADRLARDSAELQSAIKGLWRLGIEVHDTHVGKITPELLPLLGFLAENEIRTLSMRTDMGLEQAHNKKHKLGAIPLGYGKGTTPGVPVVDPVLGPIVREMFMQAAKGAEIGTLCAYYYQQTGRRIDRRVVQRLLRNPFYCGVLVNFKERHSILERRYGRDKEDWKHNQHDNPLIDQDTYLAVQDALTRHANVGQHRSQRSRYALQGLLWCAQCNRRMEGNPGDRQRAAYYRCPLCRKKRGLRKVEVAVRRALEYAVLTDEDEKRYRARAIEQERSVLEREFSDLHAHIERLTRQRQRLYQRLDEGIIDPEQYRVQVLALDRERAGRQERQAALKRQLARVPTVPDKSEIDWTHWTALLASQDVASQQRIYRHCCAAIRLNTAANTLTVRYTPQVLHLMRAEERTEPLEL